MNATTLHGLVWHAVPVIVMAGLALYSALLFLVLYGLLRTRSGERRGAHREYLSFALLCIVICAYDIACTGLYNSHSTAEGIAWQRGQFLCSAWIGAMYMIFTWDFIGRPMHGFARLLTGALGALGPVVALWHSPFTLTVDRPATKHIVLGHWLDVTYWECDTGFLCVLLFVLFFVGYCTALSNAVRFLRASPTRGATGFILSVMLSGSAATLDSFSSAGVITLPYTFEYGCTLIVIAMGYAVFARFSELHERVEELNTDLFHSNEGLALALAEARESATVKTEFLAAMSHELRTPLNAIINLPEGLLEQFGEVPRVRCRSCQQWYELDAYDVVGSATACPNCGVVGAFEAVNEQQFQGDPAEARKCLATVTRSGRHLLGLLNEILDASRLELGRTELTLEDLDLSELVSNVTESLASIGDRSSVELRMHVEPGLKLHGDRVRVSQVLYNLVSNAIKFSPPRSEVHIDCSQADDTHVLITVRDQGVGIAPEHHKLIFEKFRQVPSEANRARGGTGLGLAISRNLVELHGGRIWVESELGKGATFYLLFPVARATQQAGARVQRSADEPIDA